MFEEPESHEVYKVEEDISIVDFTKKMLNNYKVKSGYGFYEFVDPEFVEQKKRVMLMDGVSKNSYYNSVNVVLPSYYSRTSE